MRDAKDVEINFGEQESNIDQVKLPVDKSDFNSSKVNYIKQDLTQSNRIYIDLDNRILRRKTNGVYVNCKIDNFTLVPTEEDLCLNQENFIGIPNYATKVDLKEGSVWDHVNGSKCKTVIRSCLERKCPRAK